MQRQTTKQKCSQPTSAGAFGRWRSRLTTTIAASLVALSSFAIVLAGSMPASAWGPTRQTFTMNDPADYVTFNSITDEDEESSISQFFHILDSVSMIKGTVITKDDKYDMTTYSSCVNVTKGIYYAEIIC